jgi:cytidylate kinase
VLYDDPNCFRIFIHAIPAARIDRLKNTYGLTEKEARTQMQNTDASRSQHYKHFTGRPYGKQEYYHLSIDTSTLGVDGSVELITEAIRMWCDVRGSHPLSTLKKEK